jgi:hypothetical protein
MTGVIVGQQWDQTTPIVETHCCATMGPRVTLKQKLSLVIVAEHCCARIMWAHISARTVLDATMTLYDISTTKDTTMNRYHIVAKTTYVMWREERLCNVNINIKK